MMAKNSIKYDFHHVLLSWTTLEYLEESSFAYVVKLSRYLKFNLQLSLL